MQNFTNILTFALNTQFQIKCNKTKQRRFCGVGALTYILTRSRPFRETCKTYTAVFSFFGSLPTVSGNETSTRIICLALAAPSLYRIIYQWLFKSWVGQNVDATSWWSVCWKWDNTGLFDHNCTWKSNEEEKETAKKKNETKLTKSTAKSHKTPTRRTSMQVESSEWLNKGGKFLEKLRCCVGWGISRQFSFTNWVRIVTWPS